MLESSQYEVGTPTASPMRALRDLAAVVERGDQLRDMPNDALNMACFSWMHELGATARVAELAGASSGDIHAVVHDARTIHAESPFVARLQSWPKGYPGDWETIRYLLDANPTGIPGTRAFGIEWSALNTAIAQQHRNKVRWQADQIIACLEEAPPQDGHVLSLACGGSSDLAWAAQACELDGVIVTLADSDADALATSSDVVSRHGGVAVVSHGNLLRTAAKLTERPVFDIVLCGGLLDYLSDRQSEWLLNTMWRGVCPGGVMAFTNIADGNPFRTWMEYVADWRLRERTRATIVRWVSALADPIPVEHDITRDPTGLAWLVSVRKGDGV